MNQNYFIKTACLLALLFTGLAFSAQAQVTETFSNAADDGQNVGDYRDRSWTGDQGGIWGATDSRLDEAIVGFGISVAIRNGSITSPISEGGVGDITITTQRLSSGTNGNLPVIINGNQVGTVPYSDQIQTTTISGLNIPGSVSVEVGPPSTVDDRVSVGEIEWTGFDPPTPMFTTTPGNLSGFEYIEGSGPSASQQFVLAGFNLDDQEDVVVTAPGSFQIATAATGPFLSSITFSGETTIEQSIFVRMAADLIIGTYTESVSVQGGGANDQSVTLSGSVSSRPPSVTSDIPYVERFRNFESFETLPHGWTVSNTNYPINNGTWGMGTNLGLRGNAYVLGVQPTNGSGNFVATVELLNNTGTALGQLYVNYTGRVERANDPAIDRSPVWTVRINGVEQNALSYSTEGNKETSQYAVISGLNISQGSTFTLSWTTNRGAGTTSQSKQIGISDVVVSANPFLAASILGSQGYRMLSSPATNASYGDLLGMVWTQGFPGATNPGGQSNVYVYDESVVPRGVGENYTAPTSINNRVGTTSDSQSSIAKGSLIFIYADNENNGQYLKFPKLLMYEGALNTTSVTRNLTYTDSGIASEDGWHMLGNPYVESILWAAIVDDGRNVNMSNIFYVYDHNTDSYRLISETGIEDEEVVIGQHQAGWVKVLDENGGSLEIIENDKTTVNAELYRNPVQFISFKIELEAGERSDYAAFTFRDDASMGIDANDAYQLQPLTNQFAHIYSRMDNDLLMLNNLPAEFVQYELPVGIHSSVNGTQTLSWSDMAELPSDWDISLIDHIANETIDLRDASSYSFTNYADAVSKSLESVEALSGRTSPVLKNSDKMEERFTLVIVPNTATSVPGEELPKVLALDQNYPNPFNPTTQIRYDLPESGDVRLDVFNIQGQRVSTLVSQNQSAGRYNVNFDASAFASGVYIYRLQAGNTVISRKMTLIK